MAVLLLTADCGATPHRTVTDHTPPPAFSAPSRSTTTAAPPPTTTAPKAPTWPEQKVAPTTAIATGFANTTAALYWIDNPIKDFGCTGGEIPVRFSLTTEKRTDGSVLPNCSNFLTDTGGLVWILSDGKSTLVLEALNPTTMAMVASHTFTEGSNTKGGSSALAATVNGPLLVSNGTQIWATNPKSGAIENEFTAVAQVTELATSPTGSLLYESSRGADGADVVTEYKLSDWHELAQVTFPAVAGGSVTAGPGVVWTSFSGGHEGETRELSSHGLATLSAPSPSDRTVATNLFDHMTGVDSITSDGVLWLHAFTGLACANPVTGAIRGEEVKVTANYSNEVVEHDHIYAAAPPPVSGVLEITPPAACFAPT